MSETSPEFGELSPDGTHYWDHEPWGWQPLWLTEEAVLEAIRRCFGPEADSATFLSSGLLNQSWHIATADGSFVLRVTRDDRTPEQVAYEHDLTRALRTRVPEVVAPIPGRHGESLQRWDGSLLSLFPYVEGISGVEVAPGERMAPIADVLGRIHRATVELAESGLPQRPGFRSVDEHPRWVWTELEPMLRRDIMENVEEAFEIIDREVDALDRWLDDLASERRLGPRALVHGDFNPRNVLMTAAPETAAAINAAVNAVIDWDDCRVDLLAWEVAQVGFGSGEYDVEEFWRTYVEAGGPLTSREFPLLGGFARMGALSELRWTSDEGRATPHAAKQVREVAAGLTWLRERWSY